MGVITDDAGSMIQTRFF